MRVVLEKTEPVTPVDRARISDSSSVSANELQIGVGTLPVRRATRASKPQVSRSRKDRDRDAEKENADPDEDPEAISKSSLVVSDADVDEECEETLIDVQVRADLAGETDEPLMSVLNVRS